VRVTLSKRENLWNNIYAWLEPRKAWSAVWRKKQPRPAPARTTPIRVQVLLVLIIEVAD